MSLYKNKLIMNIFIGSLPFAVRSEGLKELFEAYGEVTSARVITDKMSGRSKGYGFVEMADDAAANKAIEELNGSDLQGRRPFTKHSFKLPTNVLRCFSSM